MTYNVSSGTLSLYTTTVGIAYENLLPRYYDVWPNTVGLHEQKHNVLTETQCF